MSQPQLIRSLKRVYPQFADQEGAEFLTSVNKHKREQAQAKLAQQRQEGMQPGIEGLTPSDINTMMRQPVTTREQQPGIPQEISRRVTPGVGIPSIPTTEGEGLPTVQEALAYQPQTLESQMDEARKQVVTDSQTILDRAFEITGGSVPSYMHIEEVARRMQLPVNHMSVVRARQELDKFYNR